MSQHFYVHPDNPQVRLISQAVQILQNGGVIVYPTDSGYALGCQMGNKDALERICRIRRIEPNHDFTLVCRDLSEISTYAKVDNTAFRLVKNNTPGPYTFIFKATKEVPRRLMNEKKKTIGIRVPANNIALALLEALGEPLLSTTLILPGSEMAEFDPRRLPTSSASSWIWWSTAGIWASSPPLWWTSPTTSPCCVAAVPGIRRRLSDLADPVPALTTPRARRGGFPAHRHRAGAALP